MNVPLFIFDKYMSVSTSVKTETHGLWTRRHSLFKQHKSVTFYLHCIAQCAANNGSTAIQVIIQTNPTALQVTAIVL